MRIKSGLMHKQKYGNKHTYIHKHRNQNINTHKQNAGGPVEVFGIWIKLIIIIKKLGPIEDPHQMAARFDGCDHECNGNRLTDWSESHTSSTTSTQCCCIDRETQTQTQPDISWDQKCEHMRKMEFDGSGMKKGARAREQDEGGEEGEWDDDDRGEWNYGVGSARSIELIKTK